MPTAQQVYERMCAFCRSGFSLRESDLWRNHQAAISRELNVSRGGTMPDQKTAEKDAKDEVYELAGRFFDNCKGTFITSCSETNKGRRDRFVRIDCKDLEHLQSVHSALCLLLEGVHETR